MSNIIGATYDSQISYPLPSPAYKMPPIKRTFRLVYTYYSPPPPPPVSCNPLPGFLASPPPSEPTPPNSPPPSLSPSPTFAPFYTPAHYLPSILAPTSVPIYAHTGLTSSSSAPTSAPTYTPTHFPRSSSASVSALTYTSAHLPPSSSAPISTFTPQTPTLLHPVSPAFRVLPPALSPFPTPPLGNHHHHHHAVAIGVSLGGIFFLAILAVCFVCCRKKRKPVPSPYGEIYSSSRRASGRQNEDSRSARGLGSSSEIEEVGDRSYAEGGQHASTYHC